MAGGGFAAGVGFTATAGLGFGVGLVAGVGADFTPAVGAGLAAGFAAFGASALDTFTIPLYYTPSCTIRPRHLSAISTTTKPPRGVVNLI